MTVYIDAEQKYEDKKNVFYKVAEEISTKFNLLSNLEVELAFVNKKEIREVNKESRGIDKSTDVLSFPYLTLKEMGKVSLDDIKDDTNLETNNGMLGEILICGEVAEMQAKEYNHSIDRELSFLFLHGMLHLLGFDHIEKADEEIMMKNAEDILGKLGINR